MYLISSQLLLKATDLDWVQVNPFTTEAVDNIHLLQHVPLKASTKSLILYNNNTEYFQVLREGIMVYHATWDFSRFQNPLHAG